MGDVHSQTAHEDHRPPTLADALPHPHPAVASVVVDGSAVLYDERSGRCHVLNPTASIIWSCLGSGGATEDLVADLAEAYSLPSAAIVGDVLDTLATLDRGHLLDDGRPRVVPTPAHGIRYLEEASTACMLAVDRLGWSTTVGVSLPSGLRLGVRTSSEAAADVVRRALGALAVHDPACPPNLSVRLESEDAGPVQSLHSLYRSCSLAVRTRSRSRAIDALVHHVWSFAAPERADVVLVSTTALERDGRLVLAPTRLRARIGAIEPRLRRAGIAVVDAPIVELGLGDVATAVVGAPLRPGADDQQVGVSTPIGRPGIELSPPPPGQYPVAGRLLVGTGGDPDRSALLAGALADLANVRSVGGARALAAAVRLSDVPTGFAESWGNVPLVDAAVALFERA